MIPTLCFADKSALQLVFYPHASRPLESTKKKKCELIEIKVELPLFPMEAEIQYTVLEESLFTINLWPWLAHQSFTPTRFREREKKKKETSLLPCDKAGITVILQKKPH